MITKPSIVAFSIRYMRSMGPISTHGRKEDDRPYKGGGRGPHREKHHGVFALREERRMALRVQD